MVDSGELSMTRVLPVAAPVEVELGLGLELEQAASPAASRPAAPTAKSRLWLCNLLISLVFLSCVRRWVLRIGGNVRLTAVHGRAQERLCRGASRPRRAWR